MIKGADLMNRAEMGDEENRRPKPRARSAGAEPGEPDEAPVPDLAQQLAERVARARVVKPAKHFHCEDCFRKGRDAAIRVIAGEEEPR